MNYRILGQQNHALLDTLELHVLARAYYAAWRVIHGMAPEGRHPMPVFNVFFDFDAFPAMPLQRRDSAAQSVAAGSMTRNST